MVSGSFVWGSKNFKVGARSFRMEVFRQYDSSPFNMTNTSYSARSAAVYNKVDKTFQYIDRYYYYGIVNGTSGNDTIEGARGRGWIRNSRIRDTWDGTLNETLNGNGGDDIISGYLGNDSLVGGLGKDILKGGGGSDTLRGGEDNDVLMSGDLSGSEQDQLYGGDGYDTFVLGEVPQGTTTISKNIPQVGFSILGQFNDFSDLMFTSFFPGAKLLKEIAPIGIDALIGGLLGYDGRTVITETYTAPSGGQYATVKDFNPLQDYAIVPVSDVDQPNVLVSDDTNGKSSLTLKYTGSSGDKTFAALEFDTAANILQNPNAQNLGTGEYNSMINVLKRTALFVNNGNVTLGLGGNGQTLSNLTQELDPQSQQLLRGLGANNFMIFGANGGVRLDGADSITHQGYSYLTGTDYDDVIAGYTSIATSLREGKTNIKAQQTIENDDNDKLYGFGGNDALDGGYGDDSLNGGSGDDYLYGRVGNDTLIGGEGSDVFVFVVNGTDTNTINDFDPTKDRLVLDVTAYTPTSAAFSATPGEKEITVEKKTEIIKTLDLKVGNHTIASLLDINSTEFAGVLKSISLKGPSIGTGTNASQVHVFGSKRNLNAGNGNDWIDGGKGNDTDGVTTFRINI